MNLCKGLVIFLAALLAAGCDTGTEVDAGKRRPTQSGQPMDPVVTARHLGAARLAAITGDQESLQRNAQAISEDMRRSMKIPDANRPIDHERARSIARAVPGVLSATWIDRSNLLVRVANAEMRNEQTIDELCNRLETLGDTLAVVVHLQDAAPATRDGMDTLSRNCQLARGDNAFMQGPRRMDVLDPAARAQYRANVELARRKVPAARTGGDQAALDAIPEM
jgi:hypothetical protein